MIRKTGDTAIDRAEERFAWFVEPIVRLSCSPLALLRSPRTRIAKLQGEVVERLERRLAEVGERGVVEDLVGAWIPRGEWDDLPRQAEREYVKERGRAVRTLRGRAVFELIERAHREVPHSPIFAVADPGTRGMALLQTHELLLDAGGFRGEPRCCKLLHAVGAIAERIHYPCLEQLWRLRCLSKRKAPGEVPKFGALVNQLGGDPSFPSGLVMLDAAQIRNADAHGRHEYDPQSRSLRLADHDWAKTFTPAQLIAVARRQLAVDESLTAALSAFVARSFLVAVVPSMGDLADAIRRKASAAELARVGAEVERQMLAMLSPAGDLIAAAKRRGT